jgi:hypothetical protein
MTKREILIFQRELKHFQYLMKHFLLTGRPSAAGTGYRSPLT